MRKILSIHRAMVIALALLMVLGVQEVSAAATDTPRLNTAHSAVAAPMATPTPPPGGEVFGPFKSEPADRLLLGQQRR
jgi:hypothetical protein